MTSPPPLDPTWCILTLDFYRELYKRPFDAGLICLTEYTTRTFVHSPDAKYTNETLVRHGYIGASPEKPAIAFSLRLFDIYRQLHRVCPRLSLDALSRSLSHLHRASNFFYIVL
jgi:hypothetical protein